MDAEIDQIAERLLKRAKGMPCETSMPESEPPLSSEARTHRAEKAGVAERFREADMNQFVRGIQDQCAPFLMGGTQGLFIHGPAGTGKTHLAVAVMKAVMERGSREQFITVPFLLMEIRSTFKDAASQSEYELVRNYSTVPLLLLDDLGAEKGSEFSTQTLYLIIDRRYATMRRTIITSNLSIGDIAERVGDRIASRIAGMCKVIEIKGQDRRLKAIQETVSPHQLSIETDPNRRSVLTQEKKARMNESLEIERRRRETPINK